MIGNILRLAVIHYTTLSCLLLPHATLGHQLFSILKTQCLNSSTAAWTSGQSLRSLEDCYWRSRQPVSDLQSIGLVQFDRAYLTCSLFRFRDVCHLLNLTNALAMQAAPPQQQQQCQSLVDSEYDVLTANAYFAAVWIGGHGPSLENIVCGPSGPRNPVWTSGVAWTRDGAQMDGATSRMLVNDTTGFNFTKSYTMVVELKRNAGRLQPFMEFTDCNDYTRTLGHFFEYPAVGQLYFSSLRTFYVQTKQAMLFTSDPGEFFKAGVAYSSVESRTKIFLESAALPDSALQYTFHPDFGLVWDYCLKIGYRNSIETMNGTMKMAAVASGFLPEDVVLRFMAGK